MNTVKTENAPTHGSQTRSGMPSDTDAFVSMELEAFKRAAKELIDAYPALSAAERANGKKCFVLLYLNLDEDPDSLNGHTAAIVLKITLRHLMQFDFPLGVKEMTA